MGTHGDIYQYVYQKLQPQGTSTHTPPARVKTNAWVDDIRAYWRQSLGIALLIVAFGGALLTQYQKIHLEIAYWSKQFTQSTKLAVNPPKPLPRSAPRVFNPLVTEDGSSIDPVNRDFSLIIPKIGVNASVIPAVDPTKPGAYLAALDKGIAHASTSYFPDEDGTVYLFSHSTNYDWFVNDLNAVFYLLKNLTEGDLIVIYYKGKQYAYTLREKKIVKPTETSYLIPQKGTKTLILQTCWPPGSTTERLLLFADLVEEQSSIL